MQIFYGNPAKVWVNGGSRSDTSLSQGCSHVNFRTSATSAGASGWGVLQGLRRELKGQKWCWHRPTGCSMSWSWFSRTVDLEKGRKEAEEPLVPLLTPALEEIRPCLHFPKCLTAWTPNLIHMGLSRCWGISWWAAARGYGGLQTPEWSYELP